MKVVLGVREPRRSEYNTVVMVPTNCNIDISYGQLAPGDPL